MAQPIDIKAVRTSPRNPPRSISPSSLEYPRQHSVRPPKPLHPVHSVEIKLLILENISHEAVETFEAEGFHVDHFRTAISEDELVEKIGQYHGIGIRSKTKITERVIKAASKVCSLFR